MASFKKFLAERRRNPEQNPKTTPIDVVRQYAERKDVDKFYLTYTREQKVGINPKSGYNTPIGIYTYPLKEIWPDINAANDVRAVPFAGTSEFVNILEYTGNKVLRSFADYKLGQYMKDMGKLEKILKKFQKTDPKSAQFYGIIGEKGAVNFLTEAEGDARDDSFGGRMWYITNQVAQVLTLKNTGARINAAMANNRTKKTSVQWNKILREVIGYDGMVDAEGKGIIHPSEPTQAVFFSKKNLKVRAQVANKREGDSLKQKFAASFNKKFLDTLMKSREFDNSSKHTLKVAYILDGPPSNEMDNYLKNDQKAVKDALEIEDDISQLKIRGSQVSIVKGAFATGTPLNRNIPGALKNWMMEGEPSFGSFGPGSIKKHDKKVVKFLFNYYSSDLKRVKRDRMGRHSAAFFFKKRDVLPDKALQAYLEKAYDKENTDALVADILANAKGPNAMSDAWQIWAWNFFEKIGKHVYQNRLFVTLFTPSTEVLKNFFEGMKSRSKAMQQHIFMDDIGDRMLRKYNGVDFIGSNLYRAMRIQANKAGLLAEWDEAFREVSRVKGTFR